MDFLSTWWPAWVAAGVVGAAIPVVIHMIHQTRAPEVPFPTLRFLRSAAERTARRRKIENLFLMILRMLLFALLAFALSRPFLSRDFSLLGEQSSSAAVLVLDNSYSMNVRGEAGTRFARAKQEARAILESPYKPTEAAVLLTNPRGDPRPEALSKDRADLFRRIDDAQVSTGRADLVSAVRHAYNLLDKARAAERRLWILTDRQALSWKGLESLEEPAAHPDVPVAVIRPTEPTLANVAVTGAEVTSRDRTVGMPVRIDVTVANTGQSPEEQRNLLLFVNDFTQARAKEAVRLSAAGTPGATETVSLTHVFEQPGPHEVRVALEGEDALATDDSRRLALTIADRVPVLVVRQKAADAPVDDANFYLVRALDPVGADAAFPWAIRPEERTADAFPPQDLARYAVVFLNNVGSLTAAAANALADYVAAGGTLVIFCGPEVSAETYNRLLGEGVAREGGLLPAPLGNRVGDAVLKTTVEKITQVQAGSPYLEDLVHSAEIYQDVLVYEYFQTPGATSEAVLARLAGGDPLLLEKPFGRGYVLLFTTSATTDWTTLPVRNLFLPLLMRIVHLARGTKDEQVNLLAGEPFEINLYPQVRAKTIVEVTGPLGPQGETASEQPETEADPARGVNRLTFGKTWNLGHYTYRVATGEGPEGVFATNPDPLESDLAEVGDASLRSRLDARECHVAASLQSLIARFETSARRELWQYFLALCLVLAVAEPLIANWMRPEHRRDRAHPTPTKREAA
jgi:hypothetical protein